MMRFFRATFFLLILANLLLFAYGQGYIGQKNSSGEPERLTSQIEPEKIKLVSKNGAPIGVGSAVAPLTNPTPNLQYSEVKPGDTKTPQASVETCRAFSPLPREQAQRLIELLRSRDGQLKLDQHALEVPSAWWVYIPPLANKELADKKAAELKKLGLQEFAVMLDSDPNQYAISLGLFKFEQGAKDFFDSLQKRGVRSARIQTRFSATDKMIVEARGTLESTAKTLASFPATFPPEFIKATHSECVLAANKQ